MAKSRTFWVTRDVTKQAKIVVWNFIAHPWKQEDGIWTWNGAGDFENISLDLCQFLGITLKPGEKIKCKLVLGE